MPRPKKNAADTAAKETVKEVKEVKEKSTAKKTASKTTVKECCFVEFADKQIPVCDLMETAKKLWKENNTGDITSVSVYVKPEESKAYYVVNDTDNGEFDI